MIAYQVFRHLGIDIHDRINDGRLLTLGEVELLTKLVGLRQDELDAMSQVDESARAVVSRVVTLEQGRMRPTVKAPAQVGANTKGTRMAYIRDYISWLTAGRRLKLEVGHPHSHSLLEATQTFVSLINARMPSRQSAQAGRQRWTRRSVHEFSRSLIPTVRTTRGRTGTSGFVTNSSSSGYSFLAFATASCLLPTPVTSTFGPGGDDRSAARQSRRAAKQRAAC